MEKILREGVMVIALQGDKLVMRRRILILDQNGKVCGSKWEVREVKLPPEILENPSDRVLQKYRKALEVGSKRSR